MTESAKKDWRELCTAVARENDPKKLGSLVEQLIRALDDRQSDSHIATHQTANRSSAIK